MFIEVYRLTNHIYRSIIQVYRRKATFIGYKLGFSIRKRWLISDTPSLSAINVFKKWDKDTLPMGNSILVIPGDCKSEE